MLHFLTDLRRIFLTRYYDLFLNNLTHCFLLYFNFISGIIVSGLADSGRGRGRRDGRLVLTVPSHQNQEQDQGAEDGNRCQYRDYD